MKLKIWFLLNEVFRFGGINKKHVSTKMIELPLAMRSMTGKEEIFKAEVYVIDVDVAFLCGKKMLEQWGSKLDTVKGVLETEMSRDPKKFKMMTTSMGHYGIRLEVQKKESGEIMYLEE